MGGDRNRPIPPGPLRYGFDDTFLSNNCTLNYAAGSAYYWNEHGQRTIYDAWEPYAQARQAIEFLNTRDKEQPFALFIAWHPPHDMGKRNGEYCYDTEPDLMGLYDAAKIRLRANVEDSPAARRQYRGYMAMCSGIDRAAGMVLDALQQQNLETNTLVVYTADHGDLLGSHHRPKPKGYPEQESIHVPLLMRLPGQLEAATNSNLLIGLLDMMPTVLSLLQLEVPATCQGRDLSKQILAKDDNAVASLPLYFFAPAWRGIYTRQYTYAFDEQPGADASVACRVLYDRLGDPVEIKNQFVSREYAATRTHLHALSREWLAGFNDPCPTSSELFRLCALDREHLTKPGAEARLKQCPVDLLRQNSFKSFLE
jgi:arylsulfatase A-like enzyme